MGFNSILSLCGSIRFFLKQKQFMNLFLLCGNYVSIALDVLALGVLALGILVISVAALGTVVLLKLWSLYLF